MNILIIMENGGDGTILLYWFEDGIEYLVADLVVDRLDELRTDAFKYYLER